MPQPIAWSRVIRASTVLTWTEKAVWDEIRMLDGGDGCWMTAQTLGSRLGLAGRTVEGLREELRRRDLLTSERRGRRVHWWVRLPDRELYPSSVRPSDTEVVALARGLDRAIGNGSRGHEGGRPS